MKKVLLSAILSAIAFSAQASNWVISNTSADYQEVFLINVDNDSNEGNTAMFWFAIVNIDKTKPHDTSITHIVGDCDSGDFTMKDTTYYLKGKVTGKVKKQSSRMTSKEGTVIYAAIQSVCKDNHNPDWINEFSGPKELAAKNQELLRDLNKELKKMQGSPF